jgi:hypothetical protein
MVFMTALFLVAAAAPSAPLTGSAALQEIRAHLEVPAVLRAEFSQTRRIAALKHPLLSKGRLVLSKQDGIVWQVEQPHSVTYALRRNGILEVTAGGVEIFKEENDSPAMRRILTLVRTLSTGDPDTVTSMFNVESQSGGARWQLTLVPRSGPLAQRMRAIQANGTTYLDSVSIIESNGDSTLIEFRNHRESPPPSAEERRLLLGG